MENYSNLLTELLPDGILVITINRPAQLNALNITTLNELSAIMAEARDAAAVKAVLLTGAGPKSFIAGADINEFLTLSPAESRQFAERGQEVLFQMERLPKPLVAAINGFALGGGCEVAMACHLRVASEEARLGQPEVKLGINPGYGGTQRLTKLVGKGKALEMMLTGNPITAAEAYRIGLVNYVQPAEQLLEFCLGLIRQMIDKAPIALAKVIEAVNASLALDEVAGYAVEADAFEACCQSSDFREGASAFVEKRRPVFTGR